MAAPLGPLIETLWYWEGPVSRYYQPGQHWRSSRELTLWHLTRGYVTLHWEGGSRYVPAGHWITPTPLRRYEVFSADATVASLRFRASHPDGRMLLCPTTPWVAPHHLNAPRQPARPSPTRQCTDGTHPPEILTPTPVAPSTAPLHQAVFALRTYLSEKLHLDLCTKPDLTTLPLNTLQRIRLNARMADCFCALAEAMGTQTVSAAEHHLHPAVTLAMQFLATRPLEKPLREAEVAQATGLSLPHLRRVFRRQLGLTLKSWDAQRLEAAIKTALQAHRYSCKEIAQQHGFSSASHFSRWFHLRTHQTPQQWVNSAAADGLV